MRKRKYMLMSCMAILIILLVAYFSTNNKTNDLKEDEMPEETAESVAILNNNDEVEKIIIKNTAEELIFEKQGRWKFNKGKVNEELIVQAENIFYYLPYIKIMEGSLEQYGLDKPVVKVRAFMKSGKTEEISVGYELATKDAYYVSMNSSEKIYVIDGYYLESLLGNESDFIEKSLDFPKTEDLTYFYLKQKGKPEVEMLLNKDSDNKIISMIKPLKNRQISLDKLKTYWLSGLEFAEAESFLDFEEEKILEYGFEDYELEFILRDSSNEVHLLIGNEIPENENLVYAKEMNKEKIIILDKDFIKRLYNANIFDIIERFISFEKPENIKRIEILKDKTYIIGIDLETSFDTNGNEILKFNAKLNNKEISEEDFENLFVELTQLSYDGETDIGKITNDINLRIIYHYNDGTEREILFKNYNKDFYSVEIEDIKDIYGINKNAVEEILKKLEEM